MCDRYAITLGLIVAIGATRAIAIETREISLYDAQIVTLYLTSTDIEEEAEFLIDDAQMLSIEVASNLDTLSVEIDFPGGISPITPGNVGSFDGIYRADEPDDISVQGMLPLGFESVPHYRFVFPSQGAGTYTVRVTGPSGLGGEDEAVAFVRVVTDSPVNAALVVAPELAFMNGDITLTVLLFEDETPIEGATIVATVIAPDEDEYTLYPVDSGADVDDAEGDGLYSVSLSLPANETGTFQVLALCTGTTSQSSDFERNVTASFEVIDPSARFASPVAITDEGVDDNSNGLFDRLRITSEIDVYDAGSYRLTAALTTSSGTLVGAVGEQTLSTGTAQVLAAYVDAEVLHSVDEWGTFNVESLVLQYYDDGTPKFIEEIAAEYETDSYSAQEFEQELIQLTGTIVDTPVDTGIDDLYDELQVDIEAIVVLDGDYDFSVGLFADCGGVDTLVAYAAGSFSAPGGFTPLDIPAVFESSAIGGKGLPGPYLVKMLMVTGEATGIFSEVGETEAYAASEFNDYIAAEDCNQNETPDQCELASDDSLDCNSNGVLDECEGPLEGACCHSNGTCLEEVEGDCTNGHFTACRTCDEAPSCYSACVGAAGCCFDAQVATGCKDFECCAAVCDIDDYCCIYGWDATCVGIAKTACESPAWSDCDGNDMADACEIEDDPDLDCNENGVLDECDIANGLSADCDGDGVPDGCVAPELGACCDEDSGTCEDDVSPCDCTGRFEAEVACSGMSPACDVAACCTPTGCSDLGYAACMAAEGIHLQQWYCAQDGFTCPTTCFDATGCCFAYDSGEGCEDLQCCGQVCAADPFCCEVVWDVSCALAAVGQCGCPEATIDSASPASGTIDARQPHPPTDSGMAARQGIGSSNSYTGGPEPIVVTLYPAVSCLGGTACWELCETGIEEVDTGSTSLAENYITHVEETSSGTYEIYLARPISAGHWTTITYLGDGSHVEYASLPGDANGNETTTSADTLALINYLNSAATPPYGDYSMDLDHSGVPTGADVARLVDILNGTDKFIAWNLESLPENSCVGESMMFGGQMEASQENLDATFAAGFLAYVTTVEITDQESYSTFVQIADALTFWCTVSLDEEDIADLIDTLGDPELVYASVEAQEYSANIIAELAE